MAKKPRTPAQLANDERLRNKSKSVDGGSPEPKPAPAEPTTYSDADVAELIRQVQELKQQSKFTQPSGLQANNGRLVGTIEKYLVDPSNYPSPVERLTNEPKLARFAFPLNYELVFDVAVSGYETKDGINQKEPRFTLQLIKIMMDEDTFEPTNKRYMLYQMIFHEDPQAALAIARENGLTVDDSNEAEFLNEMRYLRMRDWLFQLEPFYPRPAQAKKNKREEVIANRVVEVYEVSGTSPQAIPTNELTQKF